MYSFEISDFLDERKHQLTPDELMYVTNIAVSPQITHVKFEFNHYVMETNDGYEFEFGYIKPEINQKVKELVRH